MAPSSKVVVKRKPKTKATGNVTASKKRTPSKAIISNVKAIKAGKKPSSRQNVEALPKDWPVQSKPPLLTPTSSALRPGSLLQEVCNGKDIRLPGKQTLAEPSIAKEKGKYIFTFSGRFSLKDFASSATVATTSKKESQDKISPDDATNSIAKTETADDVVQINDEDDDDEENGNLDEEEEDASNTSDANKDSKADTASGADADDDDSTAKKLPAKPNTTTSTAPCLLQLGKVVGLATRTPQLRVPFPNSNKVLVFPGKKVDTSSKYMWLNCSTKKKGSVTCKGIFSSMVVFGTPKWETTENGGDEDSSKPSSHIVSPDSSAKTDDGPTDTKDVSLPIASDTAATDPSSTKNTFRHYGGSVRTVDGYLKGKKKKTGPFDPSTPAPFIPIGTKSMSSLQKFNAPPLEMASNLALDVQTPKPKQSNKDKENNESDDDEYLSDVDFTTPVMATKARSAPRRRASAKKAKYSVDLMDSDADEEESDDSDTEDSKANAKSNKTSSKKTKTMGKTTINIESDDDVDSEVRESEEASDSSSAGNKQLAEKTTRKRKNSTKESHDSKRPKTSKAGTTPRRRSSTANASAIIDLQESDADIIDVDKNEGAKAAKTLTNKKKTPAKAQSKTTSSKRTSTAKRGMTKLESPRAESSDDDDEYDDHSDVSLPPAMTASNSRRQRRSTISKKSYKDEDDDESEEEDANLPTTRGKNGPTRSGRLTKPAARQARRAAVEKHDDESSDEGGDSVEKQEDDGSNSSFSISRVGAGKKTSKVESAVEPKKRAPRRSQTKKKEPAKPTSISIDDSESENQTSVQTSQRKSTNAPAEAKTLAPSVTEKAKIQQSNVSSSERISSPVAKASPFRSRRTKSPGSSKAKSPSNVFDVLVDDNFNF